MQDQRLVLVVDDSDVDRAQLRTRLRDHGYAAAEAADPVAALETARDRLPDAVVLDLELAGADGFEVLERLTEDPALAHIPVVVVTRHREVEYAAKALRSGAHDYLRKPVEEDELLARLAAALRTKGLHDTLRASNERLGALAGTDALTGIFNRRALDDELERQVARARRYDRPLSLLLLDLDGFGEINDLHGAELGDKVLAMCAKRLRQRARAADVVGRWGADEFMIIAPDIDAQGADVLADAVRATIARPSFIVDGRRIGVRASVGYAEWAGEDPEDLVERVDGALYDAKASGREG